MDEDERQLAELVSSLLNATEVSPETEEIAKRIRSMLWHHPSRNRLIDVVVDLGHEPSEISGTALGKIFPGAVTRRSRAEAWKIFIENRRLVGFAIKYLRLRHSQDVTDLLEDEFFRVILFWDPQRGALSTYFLNCAKRVKTELMVVRGGIWIPKNQADLIRKMLAIEQSNPGMAAEQLAERLGITEMGLKSIRQLQMAGGCRVKLAQAHGAAATASPEKQMMAVEEEARGSIPGDERITGICTVFGIPVGRAEEARNALEMLPRQHQEILGSFLGSDGRPKATFGQVAHDYGVSELEARKLIVAAMEGLRFILGLENGTCAETSGKGTKTIHTLLQSLGLPRDKIGEVRGAVQALPDRCKSIINSRFGLDGQLARAARQIALQYGISRQAVENSVCRGLGLLRLSLGIRKGTFPSHHAQPAGKRRSVRLANSPHGLLEKLGLPDDGLADALEALKILPPQHQAIMGSVFCLDGQPKASYRHIGRENGMTESTVYERVVASLKKMRFILGLEGGDEHAATIRVRREKLPGGVPESGGAGPEDSTIASNREKPQGKPICTTPPRNIHALVQELGLPAGRIDDVRRAVRALPGKQQKYLGSYYGLGGCPARTLQDIGDEHIVSRQAVHCALSKALGNLRAMLSEVCAAPIPNATITPAEQRELVQNGRQVAAKMAKEAIPPKQLKEAKIPA